ncbi:PspA-associated protein PspAB [Nocardioides sp. SYSU DS0663]|uniref:PspA-associated protein PspAB n=1 Tax=Nocardioides sp. SYSU DS0663 TaxID=3416445 RepID=UPI003F4C480C
MGFLDSILGRTRPKQANLDALFLVPSAAVTLQTSLGLAPTGDGSVCYRAAAGAGFGQTQDDILELLRQAADAPEVEVSADGFGFTWLQVHRDPSETSGLCTDLHAVNTGLEAEGFGPALLCSLIPFADATGRRVGLVYLYKQGTFYAFAPAPGGGQRRDNLLEIQVRDALAAELPVEPELSRWLAIWGAPGL